MQLGGRLFLYVSFSPLSLHAESSFKGDSQNKDFSEFFPEKQQHCPVSVQGPALPDTRGLREVPAQLQACSVGV